VPTLLELLSQHVDRGGDHWLWQGAVSSEGYALFTYLGVTRHAHRWVYEETVGPVPKGAYVLQRCGVRLCMRPSDLYVGDHAQSMRQRDTFGRTARGARHGSKTRPGRVISGENHWDSRLDWPTVREIRARHEAGESTRALAGRYGVRQNTIWKIISGRAWKEPPQASESP
jgi:HNH endonuclease